MRPGIPSCVTKPVATYAAAAQWKSRCQARLFATANPAPEHAIVRHSIPSDSRVENPAKRTCLDAVGAPPARYPTVVHQHFHPIGAAVGKQISTVRLRRTEHRHHPRQSGIGAGAHVHGLGGEPDGVDADHRSSSQKGGPGSGTFGRPVHFDGAAWVWNFEADSR